VIPAGVSFTDVLVVPLSDAIEEADETAVLTLTAGVAYTVGAASSATVTITDGADRIISGLAAPSGANIGETINVTVATRNQGTRAAGPGTTRIWLSTDKLIDAGDTLLAEYAVPGLSPKLRVTSLPTRSSSCTERHSKPTAASMASGPSSSSFRPCVRMGHQPCPAQGWG